MLGALAIGFFLEHFLPVHLETTRAGVVALELFGSGLVVCAVLLASFAFLSFRNAKTSPLPVRPTTALIVGGPFRLSRNPLYLSLFLLQAGVSLIANALWPLLLLVPAFIAIRTLVVAREERYLRGRFGSDYEAYCRRVRRWL